MKGQMLLYEYDILKTLEHPNIIKIYTLLKYTHLLILSMPLSLSNLQDFQSDKISLNDLECSQIMKGIFSGLAYLHEEKNIIHRDLKPANIVVKTPKVLTQCKIIDFGIATHNKPDQLRKYGNIGTLVYQPPEQVINKFNYGKGADIWAAGIITYQLLTGKHPFVVSDDNTDQIKEKILNFKLLSFPKDSSIHPQAQHLLSRLLVREQSHRYSAYEALRHPWITRELDSTPPLTKNEMKTQLGEQFWIEERLRKVCNTKHNLIQVTSLIFFAGIIKFNNSPKKSQLIDQKYKLKLNAQEASGTGSPNKKGQSWRRGTTLGHPPPILIQKTSSLMAKEEIMNKLQLKADQLHLDDGDDENAHNYFELSNSVNQDVLSPDVKEFLRKNRIRVRKSNGKSSRGSINSNQNKPHRKSSHQVDFMGSGSEQHHLMVPTQSKKGKGRSTSKSNTLHSDASSPRSPAEIKMNLSGNEAFSDLENSQLNISAEQSPNVSQGGSRVPQKRLSQLPDIEERKSLQAKNSGQQQPMEILHRIKLQKAEVKDLRISQKLQPSTTLSLTSSGTGQNFENYLQGAMKTGSSLNSNKLQQQKKSQHQDPVLTSQQLSKMMQEQLRNEEEEKRPSPSGGSNSSNLGGVSRGAKLTQKINQDKKQQQRASSSHGNYRSNAQEVAPSITTFDFNSIQSSGVAKQSSLGGNKLKGAAQRAQGNALMKNIQYQ